MQQSINCTDQIRCSLSKQIRPMVRVVCVYAVCGVWDPDARVKIDLFAFALEVVWDVGVSDVRICCRCYFCYYFVCFGACEVACRSFGSVGRASVS